MSKITIVTDTAACLPAEAAAKLGIELVPMSVSVGQQTFREGVDMDMAALYELLRRGEMPTTSQPAPGDFLQVFQPLVDAGHQVIGVFVTGKASGTVQSARIAAEMLPAGAVTVFDSESFAMGTGLLAIAAAEAALAGHPVDQIIHLLEQLRSATHVYAAVPTLKYLQKSGRVNMTKALIGRMLNIKPILGTDQGNVQVVDKARSWPAAINRMVELIKEAAGGHPVAVAVHHAEDTVAAGELLAKLQAELDVRQHYVCDISASLAMHGGPGMLGVAFHPAVTSIASS
ncbi:MAG: DegV family protein [Bacillota bacterium]|jgi:DegV family protein with EDD domain